MTPAERALLVSIAKMVSGDSNEFCRLREMVEAVRSEDTKRPLSAQMPIESREAYNESILA